MRQFAQALAAVLLSATAEAQEQGAQALGGPPGWVMLQQGDPFAEPETSIVRFRYEMNPLGFMYGCELGRSVSVFWLPSKPPAVQAGSSMVVTFTVNGAVAANKLMQRTNEGIWVWTEATRSARRLPESINSARTGFIGISGGGVTDVVPFDEDANGGAAEVVLVACSQ